MKLDDFEAVFRSSVKDRFHYEEPQVNSVLLVTDMDKEAAAELEAVVKPFVEGLVFSDLGWRTIARDEYSNVPELVGLVGNQASDLIVTYRHINGAIKDLPHSLGSYVDSLTQATSVPVLLLPPPTGERFAATMERPRKVLVVTDHIQGDDRLVNWGVFVCPDEGELLLAHVEDDATFQRYEQIIGMIPDIDTATFIERVRTKLLDRPEFYINTIAEALRERNQERVTPLVTMGHALSDYKRIISEHNVDLIVLNTKDDNQLAMHGMAYAISVEIQYCPLLLL